MLSWYSQTLHTKSGKGGSRLWSKDAAISLQQEEPWEDSLQARKLARHAAQFSEKRQGWYYLDLHLRLPDYVVNMAQQLAMQESLAVRSPYLNTHVMDMLTRLPAALQDGTAKDSLLTLLAQRYIPDSVETQSKLPLIAPTASLFKVADSDLLRQTLSTEALQAIGIFDPLVVKGLLEKKRDEAALRELLLVFTTQLLCQLFGAGL